MMKLLFKITYAVLVLAFLAYVIVPSPSFPEPPPGAKQSGEPADTETPLRRAYFTDLNRDEAMTHYKSQFSGLPTLRLNYPPEEAQGIIRDQTRSSYLEELVHPFRESLYVSGFVPTLSKDAIVIEGREYNQKITVRYVPSALAARVIYVLIVSFVGYLVIINLAKLLQSYWVWFRKEIWRVLKLR